MRVWRALARDLAALRDVHDAAVEPRDGFSPAALKSMLRAQRVWLARFDGKIAGLCLLGQRGYVSAIAVKPMLRGRGVGTALLRAAIEAGAKRCEIRAGNVASERLFTAAGFEVTGVRACRYADGEAALVLARG